MENKYFTPSIEDIRVGYECEIYPNKGYEDTWIPTIGKCEEVPGNGVKSCNLDELTYDCLIDGHIGIRVPYLTKEQIEAEGWKVTTPTPKATIHWKLFITKGNVMGGLLNDGRLELVLQDVLLDDRTEATSNGRIYLGECKDINTFRMICKLLGI